MNPAIQALYDTLTSQVLGSEQASELVIIGLLGRGHVLVQGGPGMGKTSLAKTLAHSVDCPFVRVQFTPDLLPADILGYTVYDQASGKFVFHRGPVFSNILLADEINRASPRTQSALLEAMNESQVSIDGQTYPLDAPFFVIATQNHLASAGTFPLPDSQLDRFLVSLDMVQPGFEVRTRILELHASGSPEQRVKPAMSREDVLQGQEAVCAVQVSPNIMRYIVLLCDETHKCDEFVAGTSSRASIALMRAAQAAAYLDGRTSVYPDDVKRVMPYVLRHRLLLRASSGRTVEQVESRLREILESTAVPAQA